MKERDVQVTGKGLLAGNRKQVCERGHSEGLSLREQGTCVGLGENLGGGFLWLYHPHEERACSGLSDQASMHGNLITPQMSLSQCQGTLKEQ